MTNSDQIVSDFIVQYPDVAAKILIKNNYKISKPITLPSITEAMFKAIYINPKKEFIKDLEFGIINKNNSYSNVVGLILSSAISIGVALSAKKTAEKQMDLQKKIALANLSQEKILALEQIRTNAETDRINILLSTLQQYQSDLQGESTQRIKDVWVYVAVLACSISVIYGTVKLIK